MSGRFPTFVLSEAEIEYAIRVGYKRSASVGHAQTATNFGTPLEIMVGHGKGTCAEWAYHLHTGLPVRWDVFGRGDGGTDFPNGANAKGQATRSTPDFWVPANNYAHHVEQGTLPKFYVQVWLAVWQPPKRVTAKIAGAITVPDFERFRTGPYGPGGIYKTATWVVARRHLRPDHVVDQEVNGRAAGSLF